MDSFALILLLLGTSLLIAEISVSGGVAGIAGLCCQLAAILLGFNSDTSLGDAVGWIGLTVLVVMVVILVFTSQKTYAALKSPVRSGPERLVGMIGETRGERSVFVDGALWETSGSKPGSARVRVVGVDGLRLVVEEVDDQPTGAPQNSA